MANLKSIPFKLVVIIVLFYGILMIFLNFSEWYQVGVLNDIKLYPFGSECCDLPFYYRSAATYAAYCLVSGLVYVSLTALSLFFFIKKNRHMGLTFLAGIIAVYVVERLAIIIVS